MSSNGYTSLNVGDTVVLDKGFNNSSEVSIVSFTPNRLFAMIEADGNRWEVMTNRLSPIDPYPQLKILGKIKLDEPKTPRIQCIYCGKEGVIPHTPDSNHCRNEECVRQGEICEEDYNLTKGEGWDEVIHKPIDHSGTCSSCGGHSDYGYCERCDDLF